MSLTNLTLPKCSITFQTNKYLQQFYYVPTDNQVLDDILKCYVQNPCNWNSTFLLELQSGYSYLLLLLYNSVLRRNDLAVSKELLGSTFELEFCFNLIQSNGFPGQILLLVFSVFLKFHPVEYLHIFFTIKLMWLKFLSNYSPVSTSLLLLWTSSWES